LAGFQPGLPVDQGVGDPGNLAEDPAVRVEEDHAARVGPCVRRDQVEDLGEHHAQAGAGHELARHVAQELLVMPRVLELRAQQIDVRAEALETRADRLLGLL